MKKLITNNSMTRILITFVLLFVSFPASAQWKVGLQAGYSHNTLATDEGYAYDRRYESAGGFTVGVPVQYNFNKWFGLRADLSLVQKNYNMHRTDLSWNSTYTDTRNNYIDLPIMASFSFGGERLRGFLNIGGYVGFWASSHRKGLDVTILGTSTENTYYQFDEKAPFDSRRDNRFEAGFAGGAGISYKATERVEVMAEFRYYYSLTDMQKQYMKFQTPRYNNTLTFQLGCLVTLGKLK